MTEDEMVEARTGNEERIKYRRKCIADLQKHVAFMKREKIGGAQLNYYIQEIGRYEYEINVLSNGGRLVAK